MKLDEWMQRNNITQSKLAELLKCSPTRVHNLLKGKFRPHPIFAKKIKALTKGMVSLDEIYDIPTFYEQEFIREIKDKALNEDVKDAHITTGDALVMCLMNTLNPLLKKPDANIA